MRSTAIAASSVTGLAAASVIAVSVGMGLQATATTARVTTVAATETTRAMTAQATTRFEDAGRVSANGVVPAPGQPSGDQPDRNLQHHRRDGRGYLHGIHRHIALCESRGRLRFGAEKWRPGGGRGALP